MSKRNISTKIFNTIFWIILILIIYKLYGVYKTYSYNGFIKAESYIGITNFTRDNEITYGYDYSYKLESETFNDAIFYKKIKVKPNTPYKVTCMVKTQNIETESGKNNGGAQISIADSTECSESIIGTNDWQELEFIIDSKNREEIEIGFRLGGNETKVKGTAWFSDFKLEEGTKDNTNNWNVACFIMKNVDVNIDNQNLKLKMSMNDIETMEENMERFKESANVLSNGKMTVEYDIYEINEPVTDITYSEEYGYYLNPLNIQDIIKQYLSNEEYDYIFVAVRLRRHYRKYRDTSKRLDWSSGEWTYEEYGYSNIRLPNDSSSYVYTYSQYINTFPEEVFIHEYLHSLERILKEREYDIPDLHDYEEYGYKEERLIGLKKWYYDYMTCNIKTNDGTKTGLDEIVYTLTPPAESDFVNATEVEFSKEAGNIFEEIINLFDSILTIIR